MISTMDDTFQHVLFLARHLNGCELTGAVITILLELGVPTKGAGFDYLKSSVVLYCSSSSPALEKDIYTAICALYSLGQNTGSVEQAIRRTITLAWADRDERMWGRYFPMDDNGNFPRPSNAEFISRIGKVVELWQECCKGVGHETIESH